MHLRPIAWMRNTLRNRLRGSMAGRLFGWGALPAVRKVRVVAATREGEKAFWATTALGRSLATWRQDARVVCDIACSNRDGLPAVYNRAIARAAPEEALVFVHDDIWLEDGRWLDKLAMAFARFDVVGIAGNRRRVAGQQFWLFSHPVGPVNTFDVPYVSGIFRYGQEPRSASVVNYGPTPAACELMDGMFLAMRAGLAQRWAVRFDERFDFHFYDMDLCRSARSAGWSLGTWPIDVVHQSHGGFTPAWHEALGLYREKWGR